MDASRFDALSRTLSVSPSRRGALRLLVGGAIGGLLDLRGWGEAGADHGCRHAGRFCRRDGQCCSGNCLGNNTCSCTRASQCPPSPNPCKKPVCTAGGKCMFGNKAEGVRCDDGDPCTENGTCDGAGRCKAGAPLGDCDRDGTCETRLMTSEGNCGACGAACAPLAPDPSVCPNGGCEGAGGPVCFVPGGHCECQNGNCCSVDAAGQVLACACSPAGQGFACNEQTCCAGGPPGSCANGVCP